MSNLQMNSAESKLIIQRATILTGLEFLWPYYQIVEEQLESLALGFVLPQWNEILIRLWQYQAQNLSELETKIKQSGGIIPEIKITLIDGKKITKNLSIQLNSPRLKEDPEKLLGAISEILTHLMPRDLHMMLDRHHQQTKRMVSQLNTIACDSQSMKSA